MSNKNQDIHWFKCADFSRKVDQTYDECPHNVLAEEFQKKTKPLYGKRIEVDFDANGQKIAIEKKSVVDQIEIIHYFQIVKCTECNTIAFRSYINRSDETKIIRNSIKNEFEDEGEIIDEMTDEEFDNYHLSSVSESYEIEEYTEFIIIEERFAPRRGTNLWRVKKIHNLPVEIQKLYKNIISVYNQDMFILCTTGLRTLIELICRDKRIMGSKEDRDNGQSKYNELYGKIKGLFEEGLLSEKVSKWCHINRVYGNEAVHVGEVPSVEYIDSALKITEYIMKLIFEKEEEILQGEFEAIKHEHNLRTGNEKLKNI
ncbi:MAG: DUF4145 domain-containing protein [Chitinophagales bacterium]